MTMNDFNKKTWESARIVHRYLKRQYLDRTELTLLCEVKEKNLTRMLDIGVGCGRTTYYFAKIAEEYEGIDYSEAMINQCKGIFKKAKNVTFHVCDVRDMSIFNDKYFDFILFSFNGIDYMSHYDRLKALKEMKRVCKSGGFVCFSTHNLQYIDKLFSFKLSPNLVALVHSFKLYIFLRIKNKDIRNLKNMKYTIINDGAQNFKLQTYYITPNEQIKQLTELGFKNIRIFSLIEGIEITDENQLDYLEDAWLYYLCET